MPSVFPELSHDLRLEYPDCLLNGATGFDTRNRWIWGLSAPPPPLFLELHAVN